MTLVGIDTLSADRTSRVLTHCASMFEFGDAVLYTHERPTIPYGHRVVLMDKIGRSEVDRWDVENMASAFDTEFCLTVQHDGWIVNPHLWTADFLNWDYIGAPWPAEWNPPARVGNGGFSLRSRRFCETVAAHAGEFDGLSADGFFCITMRERFIALGIRYAPLHLAGRFSWESDCPDVVAGPHASFGFHGWVNGKTPEEYDKLLGSYG